MTFVISLLRDQGLVTWSTAGFFIVRVVASAWPPRRGGAGSSGDCRAAWHPSWCRRVGAAVRFLGDVAAR
ncbi:hypothetical protein [Streptomyces sp. NPDC002133]|uniref:hypothetical protein n=1 Tax=Streptomyces sp. NPDC002133 TaxID=3154409 RepID=UPI0033252F37